MKSTDSQIAITYSLPWHRHGIESMDIRVRVDKLKAKIQEIELLNTATITYVSDDHK